MFKKKIQLGTHQGSFHADDVFATATLQIVFEKEGRKTTVHRISHKDAEKAPSDWIIYDIGSVYDPEKNRFDHHQKQGAGSRTNGIEYASFGLIWKHFAHKICSRYVMEEIDKTLVSGVDAIDNGQNIATFSVDDVSTYNVSSMIGSLNPVWDLDEDLDKQFAIAVAEAKKILTRLIASAQAQERANVIVDEAYSQYDEKRIIVMDRVMLRRNVTIAAIDIPKALYAIFKRPDGEYRILALRDSMDSFKPRKAFPESWAGASGRQLQEITKVNEATFCHRGRFLAGTKTLESAVRLAKIAL